MAGASSSSTQFTPKAIPRLASSKKLSSELTQMGLSFAKAQPPRVIFRTRRGLAASASVGAAGTKNPCALSSKPYSCTITPVPTGPSVLQIVDSTRWYCLRLEGHGCRCFLMRLQSAISKTTHHGGRRGGLAHEQSHNVARTISNCTSCRPAAQSSTRRFSIELNTDTKKGLGIYAKSLISLLIIGGRCKFRTCDPCSVNAVLYP